MNQSRNPPLFFGRTAMQAKDVLKLNLNSTKDMLNMYLSDLAGC